MFKEEKTVVVELTLSVVNAGESENDHLLEL
jgi:hypothetical protein